MSGYWGIVILLTLSAKKVHSHLTTVPRDTEAGINETTYLNCSTSFKGTNVAWYHYRVGEPYTRNDVFEGGSIHRNYRDRFSIKEEDRAKGIFNLVIDNVQVEDAGKYECQDEEGIGEKSSAILVVLEDSLKCGSNANENGFVGPNSCSIEPEMVQLSCDVRYHGDSPPELEWVIDGGGNSTRIVPSKLCKSSGSRITCNTTVKAQLQMNTYTFSCRSSRSTDFSSNQCIYEDFVVVYAFNNNKTVQMKIGDEPNCTANSNQECSYRWKFVEGNQEMTMSESSKLKFDRVGWFRCEAQCALGSKVCTVVPMVVHVSAAAVSDDCRTALIIVLSLLGGVTGLLISMIIAVLILCTQRRKDRRRRKKEDTLKPTNEEGVESTLIRNHNMKDSSRFENGGQAYDILKKQYDELSQAYDKKNADYEESEDANKRLKTKHDELLVTYNMKDAEHEELQQAHDRLKTQHDEKVKELVENIDNKQREIGELKGRLESIELYLYQTHPKRFEYKDKPVLVGAIKAGRTRSRAKKQIRGMAILDDELFIVYRESSEVDVYDSTNLTLNRKWELDGLANPWDVSSCSRNKCLFLCDWKDNNNIEIFIVDPNGTIIRKWSVGDNGGCLSVTQESNLIVSIVKKNKIQEYSLDGHLECELALPAGEGVAHPLRTVKLPAGHYLVSHGNSNNDLHRLCIINDQGKVIKSLGGKKGSNLGLLNIPIYFALAQDGSIFTSDYRNRRILLFSRELNYEKELTFTDLRDGLHSCDRICFDDSNGRLLIADNEYVSSGNKTVPKDGRILVFDMMNPNRSEGEGTISYELSENGPISSHI